MSSKLEDAKILPDDGIARSCGYVPPNDGTALSSAFDEKIHAYPHPFIITDFDDTGEFDELDLPRPLLELKMCMMSNEIREKERWWEKMKNEEIKAKWKQEVEESEKEEDNFRLRLSEKMINYVLQELEGYAAIRDPDTGIELACWERVWRSDSLISTDLRAKLLDAAALLETGEPDWHPRSNNQVLDLVHPSLYPIVYNNSLGWDSASQSFKPIPPPEPSPDSSHLSSRFCWLPSDFSVSETGSVMLSSPYINNLDPKAHAIVYPVISSLVEAAVPLWERVLSDLRAPLSPSRIKQESIYYCNSSFYSGYVKSIDCIWKGESPIPDSDEEDEHDEDPDAWYDKRVQDQTVYESLDAYDGALEKTVKKTVSLSRSTIQVIVKLANIILTPEKPEYGGRTWHVEGMQNEHIVSTFIYVISFRWPSFSYFSTY
jgi:hypothetical protein